MSEAEKVTKLIEAMEKIYECEWPAGDQKLGAQIAARMWAIADEVLEEISPS